MCVRIYDINSCVKRDNFWVWPIGSGHWGCCMGTHFMLLQYGGECNGELFMNSVLPMKELESRLCHGIPSGQSFETFLAVRMTNWLGLVYTRARKTICYARAAKEACRQAIRDHQPTDDRTVSLRYDSWTLIFSPNMCVCVTRDAQFRWLLTKSIRTSAQHTGAIHPWEQQRNRSAILTAVAFEKETNAEKQINTSISYNTSFTIICISFQNVLIVIGTQIRAITYW